MHALTHTPHTSDPTLKCREKIAYTSHTHHTLGVVYKGIKVRPLHFILQLVLHDFIA